MADKIYVEFQSLENSAQLLQSLSGKLNTIATSLKNLNIPKDASPNRRLSSGSCRLSGAAGVRSVQLDSLKTTVRTYGSVVDSYANYTNALAGQINNAISLFKETEKELAMASGVDTGEARKSGSAEDAERAKRENEAKWFKIGVSALCIVGSVALIVATGGGAAVVIGAGVASGAITGFANNAADQYVEKGNNDFDWKDAGKDAVIGGIVGGVTSAVSYGVGGSAANVLHNTVIKNASSQFLNNTTAQVVTNAGIRGGAQVVSGMASRAAGEMTYDVLTEGRINVGDAWDAAMDGKAVAFDAAVGAFSGYNEGKHKIQAEKDYYDANNVNKNLDPKYKNPETKQADYVAMGRAGDDCAVDRKWWQKDLNKGEVISRYGNQSGAFFAPDGTPYNERALPQMENAGVLHRYEVVNPNITNAKESIAASLPGLNNGGGSQIRFTDPNNSDSFLSAIDLIKNGDIVEILDNNTFTSSNYTMRHEGRNE